MLPRTCPECKTRRKNFWKILVVGITNYRDSSRNQTFAYDSLNRLISAQNTGTDCTKKTVNNLTEYWGNTYGYDAWGNLLQKTVTKCGAENLSVTALANNQLSGYSYDSAGNMTHDATTGNNYSYDQENRIAGAAGFTYTYDADGSRVMKSNGSAGTMYWSMSPGIVAESDLSGNLTSEYVFFNGKRVARKDLPGGVVSYYFSDSLKAAAVITDSAGNIKSDSDFYPWGGELQFLNNDSNHYKYGGHERDNETGLDYMLARYFSNPLSRFLTPDWAAKPITVPYANFGNPQSLNLYRYAQNNPTTFGDPDGHCDICQILLQKVTGWVADGIARDGSGTQFAKNTATGLGKGAANFFIKWDNGNRNMLNKIGGHYKPIEEYKPSNTTEKQAMGTGEGAASLGLAVVGSRGGGTEPLRVNTDELGPAAGGKAPDQVQPGTTNVKGTYMPEERPGSQEPYSAHYDEYGRQTGRTDYTNAPDATTHTNPHYHTREYGAGYGPKGKESGPIPGEHPKDQQ